MSEDATTIRVDAEVRLEARLAPGAPDAIAIICHPHPSYGGSMSNNVVRTARDALSALQYTTLRFNFRGVGGSTGRFANGVGERQDLQAVCRYARDELNAARVHLVGYSFGAWIAWESLQDGLSVQSLSLVSPPLDFLDFRARSVDLPRALVVVGDRDAFCAVAHLEEWLASWAPQAPERVEVLEGCDHFYWGFEDQLKAQLETFLELA